MKIAIVTATYPPYHGGMGNVAADHAAMLASAEHDVTVLMPAVSREPQAVSKKSQPKAARPPAENVKCQKLRSLLRYGNAAVVPQLLWRLRTFDAVELHYPFFGGAEWVWLWKKTFGRKKRLVVLYHMDTVGKGWIGAVFRLYRKLFLRRILSAADIVAATSLDYLASSQAAAFASDPKAREVPLSVDTERFLPALERNRDTVLFVGGLDRAHYFKGVGVLLEAFAKVLEDAPEVKLLLIGGGELRESYEKRAEELGIGSRTRFTGRVSREELPEMYRMGAVAILPSLDRSEAFGLVLLEAAASGLPAIASDLPGVRTVIERGETGELVPPGDAEALAAAMLRVLGDPDRADEVGKRARERAVSRYGGEAARKRLLDIFGS